MANLKEVRTRITSVNSTRQITNAMRMVSASKLRRAQNQILNLRPFADHLHKILLNITIEEEEQSAFHQIQRTNKVILLVFTSNKGLCGAFNSNVIKTTRQRIEDLYLERPSLQIELICIGKKGLEFFQKDKTVKIRASYNDLFDELNFEKANQVAEKIMEEFCQGEIECVECIYNEFKNAITQKVQVEQFLPLPTHNKGATDCNYYLYEPKKTEILDTLIPQVLKIHFYKIALDSYASEHGARMSSMHKATDNASDLIKNLKLIYNKARQTSITNEIIEIIGGAEALKNAL